MQVRLQNTVAYEAHQVEITAAKMTNAHKVHILGWSAFNWKTISVKFVPTPYTQNVNTKHCET